ncbi:RecT family recombinase [Shouchella miscanthi]|uniref:RecT family recombinase n=1 Tax=Shouchella miscanthi TaxID=2598861 RepID=UPI0011A282DC|nr:RecT family recombinase [Shouchella miscanthi]
MTEQDANIEETNVQDTDLQETEKLKNEVAKTNGTSLLQFTDEKIAVIRNTVAKGATNDELEMFIHLAQRYQLDPFLKEIWFIKRAKKIKDSNGNWDYKRLPSGEVDYTGVDPIIMTSRDGYVKVAQSDPDYEELSSFEIRQKDKFSFNPMTKEIHHEIGSDRGAITGAWAICRKKGREPAVALVDFNEYKNAAGKNNVWDNYPSAMIKKVAEVLVLKRQFNINGLVTEEEMPKQYSFEYDDPNLKRLENRPQNQDNVIDQEEKEKLKKEWLQAMEEVKSLMDDLGMAVDEFEAIVQFDLKITSDRKHWTLDEIKKVSDHLKKRLDGVDTTSDGN